MVREGEKGEPPIPLPFLTPLIPPLLLAAAFDRCTEAVSLLSLERVQDYDLYYRRDGRAKELLGGEAILRILKSRVDYDGESIIP